jgi:hypothetical protein
MLCIRAAAMPSVLQGIFFVTILAVTRRRVTPCVHNQTVDAAASDAPLCAASCDRAAVLSKPHSFAQPVEVHVTQPLGRALPKLPPSARPE